MRTYKADEPLRRTRLKALETAHYHVGRNYTDPALKRAAAEDLLKFRVFTGAQVAEWLGLPPYSIDGQGDILKWGASQITADQLETAIALAKCGVEGTKPKTLIYTAYSIDKMTFDMIGGLLGLHKNVCRRIVRRVEGAPWS